MSDNHSADLLGCYGNPEISTPHLDQLAQEGARFDNAFCVNAMCSPCRASVLSGLMPSQHGIHTWIDDRRMETWPNNWNALDGIDTLPEILGRNGYQTALVGKYHLGSPFQSQNGFDHWVTFPHGHTRNFWGNTVIENDKQYLYEGHSVDFFTEKAVEYIGEQDNEQPFFMFLSYNAPYGHWPAIKEPAKNRFAALYADTPMHSVPREGISREMFERVLLSMHDSGQGLDYSATMRIPNDITSLRNYFSQMSMVDDGVGQVMAALQQQGLDENTLVVYTSDHGFSLGHHGFWGHGQATWPANTHRAAFSVPLLMRWKGMISAETTSQHTVSQLDLFDTLLDYAGVDNQWETPSRSLVGLVDGGDSAEWDNTIFMEQEETRAVRTDRWLYMQRFSQCDQFPLTDALFDLQVDPHERHNRIEDPTYQETIHSLRQQIEVFFAQNADPQFDLWQGGTTKSNSSRPWLWPTMWGDDWQPTF